MKEDSVVISDAGPTATLARFRRLTRRDSLLETFPAQARSKVGGSRMSGVRFASDVAVGSAGAKGNFSAFVSDADIPA